MAVWAGDGHHGRNHLAGDQSVVCDAFENETTAAAHVVLPVAQWAEEEGTMTNLEGRVILRQPVVAPPAGVRTDLDVMRELAERLGVGSSFAFHSPREAFDELRLLAKQGVVTLVTATRDVQRSQAAVLATLLG